jgi:hypothetical protein
MDVDYACPTPTLERDKSLRAEQPFLIGNMEVLLCRVKR